MLASADIRMRWFCVWIGLGGPSFSLISESQWSARRVLGRVSFETLQFVSPFPASLYCSRVILNQTITTGVVSDLQVSESAWPFILVFIRSLIL